MRLRGPIEIEEFDFKKKYDNLFYSYVFHPFSILIKRVEIEAFKACEKSSKLLN